MKTLTSLQISTSPTITVILNPNKKVHIGLQTRHQRLRVSFRAQERNLDSFFMSCETQH